MKKSKRNRQSQPAPTNHQNTQEQLETIVKNENTIMKILKWFFKWQTLVGIATIVSAIIAIWMILPKKTKEEKLMEKIDGNVEQILQTFKPESINVNGPKKDAGIMVRNFQYAVINYVNAWKDVEAIKDMSEYEDNTPEDIINTLLSQLSVIHNHVKKGHPVLDNMKKIVLYGKENNIVEFIPNLAQIQNLINKSEITEKTTEKSTEAFVTKMHNLLNKISNEEINTLPQKDLIKASKSLHEIYKNEGQLTFVYELTSYLILLNTNYMSYLNRPTF